MLSGSAATWLVRPTPRPSVIISIAVASVNGYALANWPYRGANIFFTILIFGAFIGYLSSAQQVFQGHYGVGVLFPAYFAVLALAIGGASMVNARLVMRFGMRYLSRRALWTLSGLSVVFLAVTAAAAGHPPLWAFMAFFMAAFFCIGILFGNFNALAMEPLGHIAGVAAAVVGSLATFMSLLLGTVIGQGYDGTVLPLVAGFAALGLAAVVVQRLTERKE